MDTLRFTIFILFVVTSYIDIWIYGIDDRRFLANELIWHANMLMICDCAYWILKLGKFFRFPIPGLRTFTKSLDFISAAYSLYISIRFRSLTLELRDQINIRHFRVHFWASQFYHSIWLIGQFLKRG